jgi:manganese/zinc/iron transport system ATP- binding protein
LELSQDILRFRDLSVRYGRVAALRNLSFEVPCGSLTAVMGPNGAGKSTLLRVAAGLEKPSTGEVRIGDAPPEHARPRLAYLPQRQAVDWDFPITVRGVVEQGCYPALRLLQRLGEAERARVNRALAELGLTEVAGRQIRRLSGGQQQRVFLARAVAQGADIFLLDEPFSGLDLFATEELGHIFRSWQKQGRTVLAAVHDLELARRRFGEAVLLRQTLIAAGRLDTVLTEDNIERAFGGQVCMHQGGLRAEDRT